MKLKAGDPVLIDLEAAQAGCSTAISRCCGRGYDPDDQHRLLRAAAEGEWRVAKWQLGVSICPYCGCSVPRRRRSIELETSSLFLMGGILYGYWAVPRAWLRPAPACPRASAGDWDRGQAAGGS